VFNDRLDRPKERFKATNINTICEQKKANTIGGFMMFESLTDEKKWCAN